VVKKVGYSNAFTFLYSKRTGTPAAAMENQVPESIAQDRFNRLVEEIHKSSLKFSKQYENTVQDVLVEEVNEHDSSMLTGRLSSNMLVHFAGDKSLIGKIIPVYLKESRGFYYIGERVQ